MALAECLETLGKTDEAGQQYALALKQKPDDPGLVRSVAIYYVRRGDLPKAAEQLVEDRQRPDSRHASAACRRPRCPGPCPRRSGRVSEPAGGDPPGRPEPGRLRPSSADDLRLKARLLAIHPQLAKRREAVSIFEKLVEDQQNAAAEDRFRLAQLYLAAGDWTKARRQLLALLAVQGNQPQYVAAYARALLAHKETGEAEHWIDRLEQIAPEIPGRRSSVPISSSARARSTRRSPPWRNSWRRPLPARPIARPASWPPPTNWNPWDRRRAAQPRLPTMGTWCPPPRRRRPNPSIGSISRRIPSRAWSWSAFSAAHPEPGGQKEMKFSLAVRLTALLLIPALLGNNFAFAAEEGN